MEDNTGKTFKKNDDERLCKESANEETGAQTSNTLRMFAQLNLDELSQVGSAEADDYEKNRKNVNGARHGRLDVVGSAATENILNPVSLEDIKDWKQDVYSGDVDGEKRVKKKKEKEEIKVYKCYGGFLMGIFRREAEVIQEREIEYIKAVVSIIDNLCRIYE